MLIVILLFELFILYFSVHFYTLSSFVFVFRVGLCLFRHVFFNSVTVRDMSTILYILYRYIHTHLQYNKWKKRSCMWYTVVSFTNRLPVATTENDDAKYTYTHGHASIVESRLPLAERSPSLNSPLTDYCVEVFELLCLDGFINHRLWISELESKSFEKYVAWTFSQFKCVFVLIWWCWTRRKSPVMFWVKNIL